MMKNVTLQGSGFLSSANRIIRAEDKHTQVYKKRVVRLAAEACLIVGQLHYKCIHNANEKFACRS